MPSIVWHIPVKGREAQEILVQSQGTIEEGFRNSSKFLDGLDNSVLATEDAWMQMLLTAEEAVEKYGIPGE
jgi:hypothetical protein